MKKILITGGTVFVSRYIAEYYVSKGYDVYVLNRNSQKQSTGVKLIEADRHALGEILKHHHFDVVVDTAYSSKDISLLLDALESYDDYVFISSSAVYPEYGIQPFQEESALALNKHWGKYGTDKMEAEETLMKINPGAYILRPSYLYGPMNNVYREAFVFDCALQDRPFYLPQNGEMPLQFFHIHDLCKFIDVILAEKPKEPIFNVGNPECISIRQWVELCYAVVGKKPEFVSVDREFEQRNYFCFHNYAYRLDVSKQCQFMRNTISLQDGFTESLNWYQYNSDKVPKKPYIDYIKQAFAL